MLTLRHVDFLTVGLSNVWHAIPESTLVDHCEQEHPRQVDQTGEEQFPGLLVPLLVTSAVTPKDVSLVGHVCVEDPAVDEEEGVTHAGVHEAVADWEHGQGVTHADAGVHARIGDAGHDVSRSGVLAPDVPRQAVEVRELPGVEQEGEIEAADVFRCEDGIGSRGRPAHEGRDGPDHGPHPCVCDGNSLQGGVDSSVEDNVGQPKSGADRIDAKEKRRRAQHGGTTGKGECLVGMQGPTDERPVSRPGHL